MLSITDESNHGKITYLYNNYHDDMIRLAKSRLKKYGCTNYEFDAEDIVQDVFLNLVKYIDSVNFDASRKELRAYVLSIVIHKSNKLLKEYEELKDKETEYSEAEICDEDLWEKLVIKERYHWVLSHIKRMDEKYNITLMYYYRNDMSVKEIAKLMGLSVETVYKRLERGKRILIEMLARDANNG